MKKVKTIRVCDNCSAPLIFTFKFAYNESFCLNCGVLGGALETGVDVPSTKELVFQKKLVNAVWSVFCKQKGLLPTSTFGRLNCKKVVPCHDHRLHLSKSEKEWDEIAKKYLVQVKGFLTPLSPIKGEGK